jgi:hypothetical protein
LVGAWLVLGWSLVEQEISAVEIQNTLLKCSESQKVQIKGSETEKEVISKAIFHRKAAKQK